MGLKLYKQKRDFDQTPEPSGKEENHKGPLKFVIQKHDATRLHYDFRLEAGGVLKSWAVPKGPSMDPAIKRLAMMVEDHPYDYRNFEGVIPEGNYGAGNVIIWDEGIYESLEDPKHSEKEILEGIKKGSIKFRIFGKKIKGAWALVKIKNSDEENAWLLIKERDNYASETDITKRNASVRSGKTVDEVNSKDKQTIKNVLKNAKHTKPPEFIKPMLTTLVDEAFDRSGWFFEIKWDGYRAIADLSNKKAKLYSRNNQPFNLHYPQIVNALDDLKLNAVFDGEIVVLDSEGKPDFQALQNFRKDNGGFLVYYIFDILFLDNVNLMNTPLETRKKILDRILPESERIRIGDHVKDEGLKFYHAAQKIGLEGIVAKNASSTYQPGVRGDDWLKIKTHLRQEVVICGFTKPRNTRKYFGALILGLYKDGELTYVGHTGSGFDHDSLKDIDSMLQKIKTEKSPFRTVPQTNEPATWVKPKYICEVEFTEWTEGGNMRHPIFKGLRSDKKPEEITVEKPVDTKTELKKEKDSNDVKVSNPDKVFWPREKYTKGDLISYYKSVSKFILPYLKDRPESLKRYPNGIEGDSFFQKNFEYAPPSFARTYKYHSDSEEKDVNYLICNNEETLLYMVNLGCIDINPWSSRINNIENPDYVIFDLDPEEIGFKKVVDAAIEIRKVLEEIEIESYPKTSGASGIHIYIPTGGKYNYDQVKQFAEIVVNIVNQKNPEWTSVVRSPSKRMGMVYLDFLQNRIGQTLAAPYSVRPKPKAPVSTPLEWKELNHKLNPEDFTIKNVLKRLAKVGDIYKPVLGKGADFSKATKKLEKIISG